MGLLYFVHQYWILEKIWILEVLTLILILVGETFNPDNILGRIYFQT